MTRIKVAFFADCLIENFDGAIRTMYEIINRIPQDRFQFLFLTGDGPLQQFGHQVFEVPSLSLPVNNNYRIAVTFSVGSRIQKALELFNPDVIHIATPSPLGNFGLNYARKRNLPVISIYHTHFISYIDYYLKQVPGLINPTKRLLISKMQAFYNQCDILYVPTYEMMTELSQLGIFSNHQRLWQRGINRTIFSPDKRDQNFINSITKNNLPNILFSSRLVWEKNLDTLIDIYKEVGKIGFHYNFIVAGDGYARSALEKRMPNAYFLGHLDHDQLSIIYASSDVFLFPSISETYGNVVVEAMASGLPCIIANGGGTKDLIEDGVNGFVCSPYNVDAYISAIQSILDSDEIRKAFRKAGMAFVSNLDWGSLTDQYFIDIEQLAQGTTLKRA